MNQIDAVRFGYFCGNADLIRWVFACHQRMLDKLVLPIEIYHNDEQIGDNNLSNDSVVYLLNNHNE